MGRFITAAAFAGASLALVAAPQDANQSRQRSDTSKMTKEQQPATDQTGNATSDRDLTQKVRQAIMNDSSLSTYAHNVKVSAKNGKVTLKGTVHSDAEKSAIEAKAVEAAGAGNVTNDMTVKPEKANRQKRTKTSEPMSETPPTTPPPK